ncbi:uncharacterized protein [Typha latifolia]|uniref:uncharacterized protein n=1 Tax=Typha latifolia TaxID=4733 RepID=UPI003C2DA12B
MGESSRSERSELPFEKHHPGCMESLFHFLALHHHHHRVRKMLAYRKHVHGARDGRPKVMGTNYSVPSTREAPCCSEKDANFLTKGKGNASSRSLVSKRRSREKDKRRKMSPLASQLLRTISIHHSESNYYVLHDELTSGHEIPSEITSHEADASSSYQQPMAETLHQGRCEMCGSINTIRDMDNDQIDKLGSQLEEKQSILQEKLNEAKGGSVKQKGDSPTEKGSNVSVYQSQEFMDLIELFRENRDLFMKILQEPSFVLASPHEQQASSEQTELLEYGTIPGSGLPGHSSASHDQDVNFQVQKIVSPPITKDNGEKDIESMSGKEVNILKPEVAAIHSSEIDSNIEHIPGSRHESRKGSNVRTEEKGTDSISGKEVNILKPEVAAIDRSVTESNIGHLPDSPSESRKLSDVRTVSDHFKVIKRKIKDIIKENKKEHTRISKDGILHKIPYGHKVTEVANNLNVLPKGRAFDRIHKYNLRIKYGREGPALSNSKEVLSMMRRSSSHTESLGRYSNLFESNSRKVSRRFSAILNSMEEGTTSQDKSSPKAFTRLFSLPEIKSHSLSSNNQNDVSIASKSVKIMSDLELDDAASGHFISNEFESLDTPVCADGNMISETLVEQTIEENSSETVYEGLGQLVSLEENNQHGMFSISDDLMAEDGLHGFGHAEVSEVPTSSSPISTPAIIQEDQMSSAKHSISGPELKFEQIHSEELELSIMQRRYLGLDCTYNKLEDMEVELDDIKHLRVHVDEKDEAEFQYVKDILTKAGFSGKEFLGEWFSPDQPVDPLLFGKTESSSLEFNISGDEPGSTRNHLLLFDLINEVLLEIHDDSFVSCPWFLCSDSRIRPMPIGYHVLEEVWANISHYLSSQLQLDQTVENVVARDLMKTDGWMNLQYDSEYVASKLEDLVLDDLLDDAIVQLRDIVLSQYICT